LGDPCPGSDGDTNCAESCDEATDSCTAPDPDYAICFPDAGPTAPSPTSQAEVEGGCATRTPKHPPANSALLLLGALLALAALGRRRTDSHSQMPTARPRDRC